MPEWLVKLLISVVSVVVTLTVTLLFNKLVGLPKGFKKIKKQSKAEKDQLKQDNQIRDKKLLDLELAFDTYREQSSKIQENLQKTDTTILDTCTKIQTSLENMQKSFDQRLDHLEKREKNALRAKILADHRLFTDSKKNPMLAWSEMEHHSFFELIKDYEDLNGNDYVHSEVIPAMNKLEVVSMTDSARLDAMYKSRKI